MKFGCKWGHLWFAAGILLSSQAAFGAGVLPSKADITVQAPYPIVLIDDPVVGTEPTYGQPPASMLAAYRGFLLAHPGIQMKTAQGPGGIYVVRFSGPGACNVAACTTTVVVPDSTGHLYQAFNQQVVDLKLLPPQTGVLPWLSTDDGGVWKIGGREYVEDLSSLGTFDVPTHYLSGDTKTAVDKVLVANRWPLNAAYVADLVKPGGGAPETLIIMPDQSAKNGPALCGGQSCPMWLLTPSTTGEWVVSLKTSGSGAYSVLYASNSRGGHDLGIADQYGWNQVSWDSMKNRWVITRVVANLPGEQ